MHSLRQHRFWLTFTLLLAMVFSISGVPAYALDCAVRASAAAAFAAPSAEGSSGCGQSGAACCCSTGAAADTSSGNELQATGCDCSLQAPAAPAPTEERKAQLLANVSAVLSFVRLHSLPAPVRVSFAAAPSQGTPRDPAYSSAPSRAPPAG